MRGPIAGRARLCPPSGQRGAAPLWSPKTARWQDPIRMEGRSELDEPNRVLVRTASPTTSPLELAFDDAELLRTWSAALDQLRLIRGAGGFRAFPTPEPKPLPRRRILDAIPCANAWPPPGGNMAALAITHSIGADASPCTPAGHSLGQPGGQPQRRRKPA